MKIRFIVLTLLVFSLQSCIVTKKKFDELLAEKVRVENELEGTQTELQGTQTKIKDLEQLLAKLKQDTLALSNDIKSKKASLADLEKEHKELETYYNNLLTNSGQLNKDLENQRARLMELKTNLDHSKTLNDSLANNLAMREAKVKELESIIEEQNEAVTALKNKISKALLNFKDGELTVEMKDGKVYVSLAEQLLFKSGSTVVDPKGKQALTQLAQALKGQNDLNIMVEGHTDNVGIGRTSKYMNDNWDLSVLRATSIVRILTTSGLTASQVTASGKSKFIPVTSNDTAEGRQKNRRTEIIITPDLTELFQLLDSK